MESEQPDVTSPTSDNKRVSVYSRLKHLPRRWQACVLLSLALVAWVMVDWWQTPPMVPDGYVSQPVALHITGHVVDEQGQPVADAIVQLARWIDEPVSATSDASGFYEFTATGPLGVPAVIASVETERGVVLRGGSRLSWPVPADDTTITVMPERTVAVRVIDADGIPVSDVMVRAMAPADIGHVTTDSAGEATLRLPANFEPHWIVAFRSGAGFDYYENYQTRPGSTAPPLPEVVELQLMGTRRVDVEVVDSDGWPVSGVRITPWVLKLMHKRGAFTAPFDALVVSNADGIAECEIPSNLEQPPMFEVVDFQGWRLIREFDGSTPRRPVLRLQRNALVRGRVTHSDGSPAEGIQIQGDGAADNHDSFRGLTQTRPDGTWEMWVAPNQTCMFGVNDQDWASQPADGLRFVENELREGVELQLVSGTLVRGRITQGDKDSPAPAAMKSVRLSRQGSVHRRARSRNERVINAGLSRLGVTDENGEYSFRVADGAYQLHLPVEPVAAIVVSVAGETEIIHDGHTAAEPPTVRLTGLVVDSTGRPAARAVVWCSPRGIKWEEVQVPAGEDGRFWLERTEELSLVYARNADGSEAVFTKVAAGAAVADLTLAPAAQLAGTVRKANGDVAPDCSVRAIIWHAGAAQPLRSGASIADEMVTADAQGKFVVKGLPPGATVQLLAWPDGTDGKPAHGHVVVTGTGTVKAPDVKPRPERPFWSTLF